MLLAIAELKQSQAEMMAQQSKHINQAAGVILAGLAIAVGILVGVYLA